MRGAAEAAEGRRKMKHDQKGFIDADAVTTTFVVLVIFGVVVGWGLAVGIPWLWGVIKPFIHAATGA
jgi:hypothetical protein